MGWAPGSVRLKLWIRLVQVAVILGVGGILLASGIVNYRAGLVRGEPVSMPDEERAKAAAQALLNDDDPSNDAQAAAEVRAAGDRIAREEHRQAALAGRGQAMLLMAIGGLGYAVVVFEVVRLAVLVRRRRRAAEACAEEAQDR